MATDPRAFNKDITNYRGHCAADVSESNQMGTVKAEMIGLLPGQVDYGDYLAFHTILNSNDMATSKLDQMRNYFKASHMPRSVKVQRR